MDSTTFDGIARTFGSTSTRRSAVRGLFAGAVALVGGAAVLEADAKRRKKGKKGRNQQQQGQFLPTGELCQNDGQCNFQQDKQICEVPQNASNSDHRCCGAQGAVCGGVNDDGDFIGPLCCIGEAGVRSFVCSESDPTRPNVQGTCIPNPSQD
jgi:hypothetical protein